MRATIPAMIISLGLTVSGSMVNAQGMTLGEFEYQNSCAVCHGTSGKGDGPVTDFLSGAVPSDLTVMQQNNGGVFPVETVYQTIAGGMDASIHGTRDMPIWGNRFRQRVGQDNDAYFSPMETERYVSARILALTEYLASIQEN